MPTTADKCAARAGLCVLGVLIVIVTCRPTTVPMIIAVVLMLLTFSYAIQMIRLDDAVAADTTPYDDDDPTQWQGR